MLFRSTQNNNDLVVAKMLADAEDNYKADAGFIDLGYGTGIKSAGDAWGRNWTLVAFGGTKGIRPECKNKRADIWLSMKEWLQNGGCIEKDDTELMDDLTGPELAPTDDGRLLLEKKESMKKRGVPSPNSADALALTFSFPVLSKSQQTLSPVTAEGNEYDPFKDM